MQDANCVMLNVEVLVAMSLILGVWMAFGTLMGKFYSPIVLGLFFFLIISPIAIMMKLFRRDALRLRRPRVKTYWLKRENKNQTHSSFHNQF